jgi:hypothetical protein
MSNDRALRVIGQTLEGAGIATFELEKQTHFYRLWIGSKHLFCFGPADISRLDAQGQKKRRGHPATARPPLASLSQQLRALGGALDRIEASAFRIMWTSDSAVLRYERSNGERNSRVFTAKELRQLGLHRSLLRSTRYIFPRLDT